MCLNDNVFVFWCLKHYNGNTWKKEKLNYDDQSFAVPKTN